MKCPDCQATLKDEVEVSDALFTICSACGSHIARAQTKVNEIWAWISVDTVDQSEGIMLFESELGPLPMIGSDKEGIARMRSLAEKKALSSGKLVKLLRFEGRFEVETIFPNVN